MDETNKISHVQQLTSVYKALGEFQISGAENVKRMAGIFAILENVIGNLQDKEKKEAHQRGENHD